MGSPKTLELDFKEFSYVNERGEFHNERPGWVSPLSNYLFENFGAVSVLETYPYIIVYCEDKVPPPSERLFKIAGMVAIWLVDGKYECPEVRTVTHIVSTCARKPCTKFADRT